LRHVSVSRAVTVSQCHRCASATALSTLLPRTSDGSASLADRMVHELTSSGSSNCAIAPQVLRRELPRIVANGIQTSVALRLRDRGMWTQLQEFLCALAEVERDSCETSCALMAACPTSAAAAELLWQQCEGGLRSLVAVEALMRRCLDEKSYEETLRVYRKAQHFGISGDRLVILALRACGGTGNLSQAHLILKRLDMQSCAKTRGAALEVFAHWGDAETAIDILLSIPAAERSEALIQAAFVACRVARHGPLVLELISEIRSAGHLVHSSTVRAAASACVATSQGAVAVQLIEDSVRSGLELEMKTRAVWIEALGAAGQVDRAWKEFQQARHSQLADASVWNAAFNVVSPVSCRALHAMDEAISGGHLPVTGTGRTVDLHFLSRGAAVAAVSWWLRKGPLPSKQSTLEFVTGWGKHTKGSHVSGNRAAVRSFLNSVSLPQTRVDNPGIIAVGADSVRQWREQIRGVNCCSSLRPPPLTSDHAAHSTSNTEEPVSVSRVLVPPAPAARAHTVRDGHIGSDNPSLHRSATPRGPPPPPVVARAKRSPAPPPSAAAAESVERAGKSARPEVQRGMVDDVAAAVCKANSPSPLDALSRRFTVPPGFTTALLKRLGQRGRAELAVAVLQHMLDTGKHLKPSCVHFAAVLGAVGKAGDSDAVSSLWEAMMARRIRADAVVLNVAMTAHTRAGRTDRAVQLLKSAMRQGVTPTVVTFSAAITACDTAENWEQAVDFFQQMQACGIVGDAIAYTSFIRALGQGGRQEKAFEAFRDMQRRNIPPTTITYNTLLRLCTCVETCRGMVVDMKRIGLTRDVFTYNTCIAVAAAAGAQADVVSWIRDMRQDDVSPDVITLNSALQVAVTKADVALLGQIRALLPDAVPNWVSFHTMLQACERAGDGKVATAIMSELDSREFPLCTSAGSSFVRVMCNAGDFEAALKWCSKMREDLVMDTQSFSAEMLAKLRAGDLQGAANSWEELVSSGCALNPLAFSVALGIYGALEDATTALVIFDSMARAGVEPDDVVYSSILDAIPVHHYRASELFYEAHLKQLWPRLLLLGPTELDVHDMSGGAAVAAFEWWVNHSESPLARLPPSTTVDVVCGRGKSRPHWRKGDSRAQLCAHFDACSVRFTSPNPGRIRVTLGGVRRR